jgi:SAM-dependent methyltransferase
MLSLVQWRRKLRWLAGYGWSAQDFAARYAGGAADAWGYRHSPRHLARAEFLIAALPAERFARALEVGCAQGFLSERLAPRVERLTACDISPAAVARARENCRDLANVEFRVVDIRDGFPGEAFDLCLFSDVLYYLSPRETDAVLDEAARRSRVGGCLIIVNEWRAGARGLTSPHYSFGRLDADARWRRADSRKAPFGDAELSLAIYRRL